MSQGPLQDDNPYASPASVGMEGMDPQGRIEPARVVVDWLDVVIYLTRAAFLIGVLLGMFLGIGSAMNWLGQLSFFLWLAAIVVLLAPFLYWLERMSSLEVKSVSVDEDGLHFHRRRLPPDDWPWETITAIRLASRWEVAWYGWFRPLLRPRERTKCNSALGHYRIQGEADYCFFPPRNPEAFVEAIARYRPELLQL